MADSNSTSEQMHELKKKISSLEWDMPNIKNEDLKARREKELSSAKNKLTELLNKQETGETEQLN